jgi:hypothetical protein
MIVVYDRFRFAGMPPGFLQQPPFASLILNVFSYRLIPPIRRSWFRVGRAFSWPVPFL